MMLDIENLSILIVDNEPDNLEVVFEALRFFGVTVETAENGEQGLEILRTFTPDLILLDLSMPVMDGWEMHSRLKANPQTRHIPVVALTAHAMSGDAERVREAGFEGYMAKPVDVKTLVQDITLVLTKDDTADLTQAQEQLQEQLQEQPQEQAQEQPQEQQEKKPFAPTDQPDALSSKG